LAGRPLRTARGRLQACRLLFATLGASRRRHAGGSPRGRRPGFREGCGGSEPPRAL